MKNNVTMTRKTGLHIIAATLLAFSSAMLMPAQASADAAPAFDADAAKRLAKKNDCFKCHALTKSKKGPSFKKVADKYRGKPDGQSKLITNFTTEPMVELSDGTKEKHKLIDTKDMKELKNLADWILSTE